MDACGGRFFHPQWPASNPNAAAVGLGANFGSLPGSEENQEMFQVHHQAFGHPQTPQIGLGTFGTHHLGHQQSWNSNGLHGGVPRSNVDQGGFPRLQMGLGSAPRTQQDLERVPVSFMGPVGAPGSHVDQRGVSRSQIGHEDIPRPQLGLGGITRPQMDHEGISRPQLGQGRVTGPHLDQNDVPRSQQDQIRVPRPQNGQGMVLPQGLGQGWPVGLPEPSGLIHNPLPVSRLVNGLSANGVGVQEEGEEIKTFRNTDELMDQFEREKVGDRFQLLEELGRGKCYDMLGLFLIGQIP